FSPVNAWWLSECSFLVYCHPGFARMAMKLAGFDNFQFFEGKGTECMICWNKSSIIVAFRGTEMKSLSSLHEIRTDLDSIPIPFALGGNVHKGFFSGLEEVWPGAVGLEQFLINLIHKDTKRSLWVTGHSLGGALASLCFARIKCATGLYVFGAPRVGNLDFVNLLKDRPVWRFEHGRDPIPMVPMDIPQLKHNFKDLGQLVYINRDGDLLFERPVLDVEEEKTKVLETITEQKKRRESLPGIVLKTVFDKEKAQKLISDINTHFIQSRSEWKEYFSSLDDGIGLKIQDHMPIYYCIKIWNYLLLCDDNEKD
nr:lipase family protein [Spirochaetaceae bacterium]